MTRSLRLMSLIWFSARRFYYDDFTYRASALTFTTLLALVPLFSVIVSLVAHFPVFTQFVSLAQDYLLNNFIPESSEQLRFYLQSFTAQAAKLPILGIFFLFITATMLIMTVEHTMNEVWQVAHRKKKFFTWLGYWLVLIALPVVIGISILISTFIFSLPWLSYESFQPWLLVLLSLFINTVMFSLLYIIVPNFHVGLSNGLAGGFLAAILFEIVKKGFGIYLKNFTSYELIYGTLATIPIFLLWIYISWLIILFGAIFTNERYKLTHRHKKPQH